MIAYLTRRLVKAALILLGVSIITFALLYLLPADPVRQIAGRSATPATVENIRQQLGLDQPFFVQYWRYLTNLLTGDFGRSYSNKLMRLRVLVQAIAIVVLVAAVWWRSQS